jgi:hypothetical protein
VLDEDPAGGQFRVGDRCDDVRRQVGPRRVGSRAFDRDVGQRDTDRLSDRRPAVDVGNDPRQAPQWE